MINKGYLTTKTDKESDEVYTPDYAIKPIIKYLDNFATKHSIQYGVLLMKQIVLMYDY